jgi:hypothetical protein
MLKDRVAGGCKRLQDLFGLRSRGGVLREVKIQQFPSFSRQFAELPVDDEGVKGL